MKHCKQCDKLKSESEFNKNKANKDGLYSICKDCRKPYTRKYYKLNSDRIIDRHKEWLNKNKDSLLIALKEKRIANEIENVNKFVCSDKFKIEGFERIPISDRYYYINKLGDVYRVSSSSIRKLAPSIDGGGYYKIDMITSDGKKTVRIHQLMAITFLNHTPNGHSLVVDHINNNKLDNRLENLQIITNRENLSKDRVGTSKYTGVYLHSREKVWIAKITYNGKQYYLGSFKCELKAHLAYQEALKKIGER